MKTTSMLWHLLLIYLSSNHCLSVKVVVTPYFTEGTAPAESFTRIKNFTSPALTRISSCYWTALELDHLASVWATRNTFFGITMKPDAKYMRVGKIANRFEFPEDTHFIPEKWLFLCFSFDNSGKELSVFVNGKKVFQNIIKKHLDNFEITKNFL